jgi:K+-transporting ATPase ATPase B chain
VTATAAIHHHARDKHRRLFEWRVLAPSIVDSFVKLSPSHMWRNPVMFVTEIGALVSTIDFVRTTVRHLARPAFIAQIAVWLWLTVVFANFAEATAEHRGKAQAEALRKARAKTRARKLVDGARHNKCRARAW